MASRTTFDPDLKLIGGQVNLINISKAITRLRAPVCTQSNCNFQCKNDARQGKREKTISSFVDGTVQGGQERSLHYSSQFPRCLTQAHVHA